MLKIKNGKWIHFNGEYLNLVYSHVNEPCWKVITKNPKYVKFGFEIKEDYCVKTFKIDELHNNSAYNLLTYCNYKRGVYFLENIWNNKAILSPELKTKIQLGIHAYDDRRIEVNYEQFMEEVEEIWEKREPIEGFVFDVPAIFYIKKKL